MKVILLGFGFEIWSLDEDVNFVLKIFVVGKENVDFKVFLKVVEFDNWEIGVGILNENLLEVLLEKSDEDVDLFLRVVLRFEFENWEVVVGMFIIVNEVEWCILVVIFGLFIVIL